MDEFFTVNFSEPEPMLELIITASKPYFRVTLTCVVCDTTHVRLYEDEVDADILLWAFEVANGVCKACKLKAATKETIETIEASDTPNFMKEK